MQKDSRKTDEHEDREAVVHTLLRHNYEYRGEVGRGGGGTVFLVWSIKYRELFVAKKIPIKPTQEITSEVEVLMNLQHPNIINMYDYWCEENNLYIILDYCPNGSLKDYIKANGPLSPQRLCQAFQEIASAIEFCHRNNVIHRDIKPANLLIDRYERIKLADFGISAHADARISTGSGSPAYMSPEALNSPRTKVDPFKCDIWAFGVTLFELATGVLPWGSMTFKEMAIEVTGGLQRRPRFVELSFFRMLKQMIEVTPDLRLSIAGVMQTEYFLSQQNKLHRVYSKRSNSRREPKMTTSPYSSVSCSKSLEHLPSQESRVDLRELKGTRCALSLILGPACPATRSQKRWPVSGYSTDTDSLS